MTKLEELIDLLTYEQLDICDKKNILRDIKKDLERLEKLEKENKELKELNEEFFDGNALRTIKIDKLEQENEELKQVLDILKEYRHILKYNGIEGTMELGWLKKEQYELLNKYLGKEQENE